MYIQREIKNKTNEKKKYRNKNNEEKERAQHRNSATKMTTDSKTEQERIYSVTHIANKFTFIIPQFLSILCSILHKV